MKIKTLIVRTLIFTFPCLFLEFYNLPERTIEARITLILLCIAVGIVLAFVQEWMLKKLNAWEEQKKMKV